MTFVLHEAKVQVTIWGHLSDALLIASGNFIRPIARVVVCLLAEPATCTCMSDATAVCLHQSMHAPKRMLEPHNIVYHHKSMCKGHNEMSGAGTKQQPKHPHMRSSNAVR